MISDTKYASKNGQVVLSANTSSMVNAKSATTNINGNAGVGVNQIDRGVTGSGANMIMMPKMTAMANHQYHQPMKSMMNYGGNNMNNANLNLINNIGNMSIKSDLHYQNGCTTMNSGNGNNVNNINSNKKYCSKTLASSSSSSTNSSTSSTGSVNVKFSGFFKDKIDEREKYLTAKYPNHQMALIKKRLKVEFWIDEQLKTLFNISDENSKEDYDICADDLVDNLLDMDTDNERKFFILNQLSKAKRGKEEIMKFVDELLIKLRLL